MCIYGTNIKFHDQIIVKHIITKKNLPKYCVLTFGASSSKTYTNQQLKNYLVNTVCSIVSINVFGLKPIHVMMNE